MFAVISGVLFAPLPFPRPDRLALVQERTKQPTQFGNLWAFAYPNFVDCRRETRALDMAAWRSNGGILTEPGTADYVNADEVSANLFSVLDVHFSQGRAFLPEEDQPGARPVAVIGHRLWQTRYSGGDAVGSELVLDGHTPDYLSVMRLALRRGRFFDDRDRLDGDPVIVIDDEMAKRAFGSNDPIGQRLWVPDMGPAPLRIVGVVAHVKHWGLAGDDDARVRAQMYYPFAQVPDPLLKRWSQLMSIAVRSSVPALALVPAVRREVTGNANDQVMYEIRTMDRLASDSLARHRFLMQLFSAFAALALLLAGLGLYGVLAYLVGRRKPELGVRIALGATPANVMWLVVRESAMMIGVGVGAGSFGAFGAVRLFQNIVVGVRPPDGPTLAAMTAILMFCAFCASFFPARRAARVDPVIALRTD